MTPVKNPILNHILISNPPNLLCGLPRLLPLLPRGHKCNRPGHSLWRVGNPSDEPRRQFPRYVSVCA